MHVKQEKIHKNKQIALILIHLKDGYGSPSSEMGLKPNPWNGEIEGSGGQFSLLVQFVKKLNWAGLAIPTSSSLHSKAVFTQNPYDFIGFKLRDFDFLKTSQEDQQDSTRPFTRAIARIALRMYFWIPKGILFYLWELNLLISHLQIQEGEGGET